MFQHSDNAAETGVDVKLSIEGMTCDSCVVHVRKALTDIKGVVAVRTLDLATGNAVVEGESNLKSEDLLKAIKRAGYRGNVLDIDASNGGKPRGQLAVGCCHGTPLF